ncbi:MAG: YajQ family cyclic di-GMP-binding protein [Gammaproteobacteria bacterium]|nr:YajQ family cyclic di-GMP-binding protein [Gammaproteobacteria bacterium]
MPSFDVVSELAMHEIVNAVDQANREVGTRFDFKGSNAKFELKEKDKTLTLEASSDFQIDQMRDVLNAKLTKRNISSKHLKIDDPVASGKLVKQTITLQEGIDMVLGKQIVQIIKDSKLKVKASIQDSKIRVVGDKKDFLQDAIALLRKQNLSLPIEFNNFRD